MFFVVTEKQSRSTSSVSRFTSATLLDSDQYPLNLIHTKSATCWMPCTSKCTFLSSYFYRPQTKFRKVYVFTGVCLSTGGCLPYCMLGYTPQDQRLTGQTPPLSRHPPCPVHAGIHTPCPVHAGIHPPRSACWDTVNKRAVCIPLECILVNFMS